MKTITLTCAQAEYVYNFMTSCIVTTTSWYEDFNNAFGEWFDHEVKMGTDTHTVQMNEVDVKDMRFCMIEEAKKLGKSVTTVATWGSLEEDYIDIKSLCMVSSIIKALR